MKYIDSFLNSITMYRLVLYGLGIMAGISIILGFAGLLPFIGIQLIQSVVVLLAACYFLNLALAKFFKAPRNTESSLITALILYFILIPPATISGILTLLLASLLAMASKYIIAFNKKHIFNPAAFALVVLGLMGNSEIAWWVANPYLSPFIIVIGLLFVRKLRRFALFISFILSALITSTLVGLSSNWFILDHLAEVVTTWPLIYFGTVMLIEPMTTPPTRKLQIIYGALVGLLYGFPFRIGPFYSTTEFALIVGNIFSYIVSPKLRLKLKLQEKAEIGKNIYSFSFMPDQKLKFTPGQYLEWTVPAGHTDSRGNRRFFTIASSPTEGEIKLGVKITPQHSSVFKKKLLAMEKGDGIFASQLTGDFILPKDKNKKIALVAGGIGITPFRSMIKHLLDTNQSRDIILFYSSADADEFVYKDLLDQAEKRAGLKVVYLLTNKGTMPINWKGRVGRITQEIVEKEAPDYRERIFYLSGPDAMVTSYKKLLLSLGVKRRNIVTDYFPGY